MRVVTHSKSYPSPNLWGTLKKQHNVNWVLQPTNISYPPNAMSDEASYPFTGLAITQPYRHFYNPFTAEDSKHSISEARDKIYDSTKNLLIFRQRKECRLIAEQTHFLAERSLLFSCNDG